MSSIAYVTSFGVQNGQDVSGNVLYGFAQRFDSRRAPGLVKGAINLVGADQIRSCVYNLLVEGEKRVLLAKSVSRPTQRRESWS